MKKFALALTASSLIAGAASADINTGFYLGAGAGMNSSNAHVSDTLGNTTYNVDLGRNRPDFSIYTGYGYVSGCTYLGAELGYTFTGGKATYSASDANDNTAQSVRLERRNVINLAFLIGQKFSPSTMGYIRLGMNSNQYRVRATETGEAQIKSNKRKLSFTPGLGLETAVTRNVRLRLEYAYDLGNKFTLGDDKVKAKNQSVKLGVAYKF